MGLSVRILTQSWEKKNKAVCLIISDFFFDDNNSLLPFYISIVLSQKNSQNNRWYILLSCVQAIYTVCRCILHFYVIIVNNHNVNYFSLYMYVFLATLVTKQLWKYVYTILHIQKRNIYDTFRVTLLTSWKHQFMTYTVLISSTHDELWQI